MIRRQHQHVQRRGATAVVMVVVMLMVALIVIGLAVTGGRDQDLTVRRVETVQSMYAAEAGMNMAIRELVTNTDEDGDGGVGTISDDDDLGTDPNIGSANVSVTASASGGDTVLSSVGRWGAARRRIEATLTGDAASSPGLAAEYFIAAGSPSQVSDINWAASPDSTGTVAMINIASTGGSFWSGGPDDNFGAEYSGSITISSAGIWTFYTESDDGSKLWVNGTEVVDNDGLHGMQERSGTINLDAGTHDILVRMIESGGGAGLIVRWQGPGGSPGKQVIPSSAFSH